MLTPLIKEMKLKEFNSEQLVRGWVRTIRSQQSVTFVTVNDGSDLSGLQLVVEKDSLFKELADRLSTGSAITASGLWKESPAKGQTGRMSLSAAPIIR